MWPCVLVAPINVVFQAFFCCIPDSGAHAPTRFCYPRELLHTHVDIREEHETEPTQYGVERAIWERKSTGVALFSLKVLDSATRGVFGGDLKHSLRKIGDSDHPVGDESRGSDPRLSSTGRDIKNVRVVP